MSFSLSKNLVSGLRKRNPEARPRNLNHACPRMNKQWTPLAIFPMARYHFILDLTPDLKGHSTTLLFKAPSPFPSLPGYPLSLLPHQTGTAAAATAPKKKIEGRWLSYWEIWPGRGRGENWKMLFVLSACFFHRSLCFLPAGNGNRISSRF